MMGVLCVINYTPLRTALAQQGMLVLLAGSSEAWGKNELRRGEERVLFAGSFEREENRLRREREERVLLTGCCEAWGKWVAWGWGWGWGERVLFAGCCEALGKMGCGARGGASPTAGCWEAAGVRVV